MVDAHGVVTAGFQQRLNLTVRHLSSRQIDTQKRVRIPVVNSNWFFAPYVVATT
jgi:hypothetical protein